MEIIGHKTYVEIPGERTHELPPLLVRGSALEAPLDEVMEVASTIVDGENLMPERSPEAMVERGRFELALNLAEQYLKVVGQWRWGDSILEWIRQCEITFESEQNLRHLLRADLWPHAGRSSFVALLADKAVPTRGVVLENAVGLRLTFRQPPPIGCFSDQFLFYLNSTVASSAYLRWARLNSDSAAYLPPERFHFQVVDMDA